jgi:hypothetical protein
VGGGAVVGVKRLAALGALLGLLTGSVVLVHGAVQPPSTATLEELRQRGFRKLRGTIDGRVFVERTRPDAPDTALPGVGILVVPRTVELVEQLEAAKRNARESLQGFRAAAPSIRATLEEYEQRLYEAGYPDAAVRASSDADGAFRAELPAGAWVLVALRSVYVPTTTHHPPPAATAQALDPLARYNTSAYQHFLPKARLMGFDAVTVWLREIEIGAGATVSLELHDRGIWLNGVAEETDVPRRARFAPKSQQR